MTKVRYEIDLAALRPVDPLAGAVRNVGPDDVAALAQLMLDAYRGTIDYDDETYEDAVAEVQSFFENDPALAHSYVVELDGTVASAVLVSMLDDDPFIGYVMTHPDHKGVHIGRRVVHHALSHAKSAGHRRAVFYITAGNHPSEALFASLGAVAVADSRD